MRTAVLAHASLTGALLLLLLAVVCVQAGVKAVARAVSRPPAPVERRVRAVPVAVDRRRRVADAA